MKLIALCIISAVLMMQLAMPIGAASASVGLYAPDRYDGIPDMCLMPMDFGYCRAKVKRYYFDMRRMKCAMFYWGGCAGNVNNFKSMDDCNKVCLDGYDYEDDAVAHRRNPSQPQLSPAAASSSSVAINNFNTKYNNQYSRSNSVRTTPSSTNVVSTQNVTASNRNFRINRNDDIVSDTDQYDQ